MPGMVQPRWKTFEEQVREIASLIYGAPCELSRIAGTNFDAVVERDLETIVIEVTRQFDVHKVRQGVTRLTLARQALAIEGILLRGFIILERLPTPAMIEAANSARFFVGSSGQFASQFFQFPVYKNARIAASFGSSIDPNTGDIDKLDYVPVRYVDVFILDGLRAKDVARLPEEDDAKRRQVMNAKWLNPLQVLGQLIPSDDIGLRIETFREIAKRAASTKNTTLAADIVTALARSNLEDINLGGLIISDTNFYELALNGSHLEI